MKQRVLQFVDFKAISVRKFCDEVGISHSLLGNNSALGSDKLEKISVKYPELSMEWIITGRGEMIYTEVPTILVGNSGEGATIAVQVLKDEIVELQRKLIICHEQKDNLVTGYLPLNMKETVGQKDLMSMRQGADVGNFDING